MPLYVIYYHNQISGKFEPYQSVRGITVFYMNIKDAEKQLRKITAYPENYEIVEYIAKQK